MNIPQGPWYIDDLLTFTVTTHRFDTGALTDADAVPAYRVYEDETGTAILTGNMAQLDDAGTTGFYSEQLTLSAANGFEAGKSYNVYVTAAVNSVTGGQSGGFKMSGVHPANLTQIGGVAQSATDLKDFADDGYDPATNKVQGVVLVDTVTTYTGNTPQTGDAYAVVNHGTHGNAALKTLIDTIDGIVDAIKLSTDNLPSDPADQSLIIAATNSIAALINALNDLSEADIRNAVGLGSANLDTQLDALPTANEVRDAVFARAFSAAYGAFTFDELTKLMVAVLLAKVSGMDTNSPAFRNLIDTANAVVATTDAFGNRTAVTLTP